MLAGAFSFFWRVLVGYESSSHTGALIVALAIAVIAWLVVHDNAAREFAYVAGVEKVIQAAQANGWTSVGMRDDWRAVWQASA